MQSYASAVSVEISGRKIKVNGADYFIKGVCYSPTPVGKSVSSGYNWFDGDNYVRDFGLIAEMGANTIRTYIPEGSSEAVTKKVLDEAWSAGLHVVVGIAVTKDLSNIDSEINYFEDVVVRYKDHPAILMWDFGNEITTEDSSWFTKLSSAAARIAAVDSAHPVIYSAKGLGKIGDASEDADDSDMASLGCWGINLYLGKDFDNTFSDYSAKSAKPLIITEFGCDAYDTASLSEAESIQADTIRSQWLDIEDNSSVCAGGFVFEWSDEWWKKLTANSSLVHDTSVDWTAVSTDYDDTSMQEEWWGINSIAEDSPSISGFYSPRSRQAYKVLKNLWTEEDSSSVFRELPKNYPNPFRAASGGTKIKFRLNFLPSKVELSIFDSNGRDVFKTSPDLKKDYDILWSPGIDQETGLYIAKIKVWDSAGSAESRLRKILLLK